MFFNPIKGTKREYFFPRAGNGKFVERGGGHLDPIQTSSPLLSVSNVSKFSAKLKKRVKTKYSKYHVGEERERERGVCVVWKPPH